MDLDETSKIIQDKRWINWGMPKDYIEYCTLWIFQQNPAAKIHFSGEAEIDYKIKSCVFEVETDSKLNLRTPPFGFIKVIKCGWGKYLVEWTMSAELGGSNTLPSLPKTLTIHVHSIFIQPKSAAADKRDEKKEGNWEIKLNDFHLRQGDQLPWKNIALLEVREDYVKLRIHTPKETFEQKIGCNEKYMVSYV